MDERKTVCNDSYIINQFFQPINLKTHSTEIYKDSATPVTVRTDDRRLISAFCEECGLYPFNPHHSE